MGTTKKINTLIYNPYNSKPYLINYQTPDMAYPATKKFYNLKYALYFIADFKEFTGITIKTN